MDVHTDRDLQSRFGREKNSSKGLNFNESEEKPQKVLIVASFEGDDEDQSTLASNTYSFNG